MPGSVDRAERARHVREELVNEFPDWDISLTYEDRWQLLVATILSAQCTDEMVNKVTPDLFAAYPTVESMAEADQENVEELVHSTGFYRQKAERLIGSAQIIVDEHGGEVPQTMSALTDLPGVGRKTANVVLHHGFGKVEGVVVDTHVQRISQRLDLVDGSTPDKIERELMELLPEEDWKRITHLFIEHGRQTCSARNPKCSDCRLLDVCPSGYPFLEDGTAASADG
ncbi:endonuclease III [Thermoplasmatales archaeon SW_10_69_26]|nr:MAG: endonuclease III [Thermoplasmatales archaeon SW_10_69_26]